MQRVLQRTSLPEQAIANPLIAAMTQGTQSLSWDAQLCMHQSKAALLAGASYRRAANLPVEEVRAARAQLLRNFLCRAPEPGDIVDADWLRVERVVAQRARAAGRQFLVKARAWAHAASSHSMP